MKKKNKNDLNIYIYKKIIKTLKKSKKKKYIFKKNG